MQQLGYSMNILEQGDLKKMLEDNLLTVENADNNQDILSYSYRDYCTD